jgi:alkanesulfonate monooxygenase SsuD/methylene tetrahydromethanopterin reductase-like flavin-dependent oxidoreductase (luciferase family)
MADGFLCHGFTTASYFTASIMPALERGLARGERRRQDIEVTAPGFIVTGRDEDEMSRSAAAVRRQLAFYGSTPAYRPVLDHHGWGDLQSELHEMARQGEWDHMGDLIDAEVLGAIACLAAARFGPAVDRINVYSPFEADDGLWALVREGFLEHQSTSARPR